MGMIIEYIPYTRYILLSIPLIYVIKFLSNKNKDKNKDNEINNYEKKLKDNQNEIKWLY